MPLEYPDLNDPKIINKIKELNPDIIFVIAYGYILPKEIIEIPKFGCFNFHGSILPKSGGEAKWFGNLSPKLKKKLTKMDRIIESERHYGKSSIKGTPTNVISSGIQRLRILKR